MQKKIINVQNECYYCFIITCTSLIVGIGTNIRDIKIEWDRARCIHQKSQKAIESNFI